MKCSPSAMPATLSLARTELHVGRQPNVITSASALPAITESSASQPSMRATATRAAMAPLVKFSKKDDSGIFFIYSSHVERQ